MQFWRTMAALLVLAVAGAQEVPTVLAPRPPAEGHESEMETVAKCLAELASKDVQARRRAVLVLGKYANFRAQAGLLRALRDPDALVRRSALVSFSEQRSIPPSASKGVLELLADPDVHVRRIASSMLPELLMRARFGAPAPRPVRPGVRPLPADPTAERLNRALGDDDPTVVKNVLSAAAMLPGGLSLEGVLACLGNRDREVRVLALQTLRRLPIRAEQQIAARLAPLVKDEDATIRRETASALARCGPAGLPALRALATDRAPGVRLEASKQLVLLQDKGAPAILTRLLQDQDIDPEERARLVRHLVLFDGPVPKLLSELASAGPTAVRAAAIQALGNRRFARQGPPPSFFLKMLDDPQAAIRQASARALLVLAPRLSLAQTRGFLASKYPDVRRAGISRARLLPADQAVEILLDACLDDDAGVRRDALMQLAIGRLPGWEDILGQSLRDPDPKIRETAVSGLAFGASTAATTQLRTFLAICEDPKLAERIRLVLNRRQKRQPTVPLRRPGIRPAPVKKP